MFRNVVRLITTDLCISRPFDLRSSDPWELQTVAGWSWWRAVPSAPTLSSPIPGRTPFCPTSSQLLSSLFSQVSAPFEQRCSGVFSGFHVDGVQPRNGAGPDSRLTSRYTMHRVPGILSRFIQVRHAVWICTFANNQFEAGGGILTACSHIVYRYTPTTSRNFSPRSPRNSICWALQVVLGTRLLSSPFFRGFGEAKDRDLQGFAGVHPLGFSVAVQETALFLDFAADSLSRRSATAFSKSWKMCSESFVYCKNPDFPESGPGALSSWRSPRTRSRRGPGRGMPRLRLGPCRGALALASPRRARGDPRSPGQGGAKKGPGPSERTSASERCLFSGDLGRGRAAPHPGEFGFPLLERGRRSCGRVLRGTWEADDGPL